MIEDELESPRLPRAKGFQGALLNFRFEAPPSQSAVDLPVLMKNSLCAQFLGAGTFDRSKNP
jgi:hypothetical protein